MDVDIERFVPLALVACISIIDHHSGLVDVSKMGKLGHTSHLGPVTCLDVVSERPDRLPSFFYQCLI
jgi:hypothetical protein